MAEEEKSIEEQFDLMPLTEAEIKAIDAPISGLRDDVAEGFIQFEVQTAEAEIARQQTPEEIFNDRMRSLNERIGEDLTEDEFNEIIAESWKALTEYRDERKSKNWVADFFATLLEIISPILNLTTAAQISGERAVFQNLRRSKRPTLLDPERLIHALYRNSLSKEDVDEKLERLGYRDEDIQAIKDTSEVIAQAQDIIRFAVREVYFPDVVAKFELDKHFTDLSKEAFDDIAKTGMTVDTFRKFWRAHWVLPSIQQAFEMLHRGAIDENTLDLIMRASDVMPGFMGPLKDIAFNPFTRVDVRRMHDFGVITDGELVQAYKDIGYKQDKAEKMAEFTKRYNKDKAEAELNRKDKQRDLTRSDIVKAYSIKLLSRLDTKQMLKDIGYDDDEAELYLDREDFKEESERVDTLTTAYKRAYVNSQWDKNRTKDMLNQLGLTQEYINYTMDAWEIERDMKVDRPTKSEILGFYKSGIIDESTAKRELAEHGYSNKYINWYLAGTKKK